MKRSPLVVILLTVFIDLVGFGIVIPVLPYYLESERFRATPLALGLLFSSYSVMQLIFSPILGRWSDKHGRRPVLLVSIIGSGVGFLILGAAGTLTMLFVGRIIAGITGGNISTAQAYIADVTTPENRARGMGLVGAAFGLGFIFGPAIGGILARFGHDVPMWSAAALCGANFLAALFLLPESRHGDRTRTSLNRWDLLHRARRHPGLVPLLIVFFLLSTAFSGFEATFALFTERRFGFTAESIGWVFAFIGLILAIVNGLLVGRVVPFFGERRVIPFAIGLTGLSLFLVPASHSVPVLFAICGLMAVGMGFNNPSLTSAVSRLSDPAEQGGMLGLAQSLAALGRIVGPAWGGFLFDWAGITVPFLSAALIMTVALSLAIAGVSRARFA